MNARQKIHQVHLQEWTIRFAEQKASGLTVRQWCEQNHYSFHSYKYWKCLLKEEVVDQTLPDIVPVTLSAFSDPGSSLEADPSAIRAIRTNRAKIANGKKTYMWVYRNRPARGTHPIVLFDWHASRRSDHPREFLKTFPELASRMAIRSTTRLPANAGILRSPAAGSMPEDLLQNS